jgi:hypothetical protein
LYWYSVCNVKQVAKFFENNRLRRIGVWRYKHDAVLSQPRRSLFYAIDLDSSDSNLATSLPQHSRLLHYDL